MSSKKENYRKKIYVNKKVTVDVEDLEGDVTRYVESHSALASQLLVYFLEKGVEKDYAVVLTNMVVNEAAYGVTYSDDVKILMDVAFE